MRFQVVVLAATHLARQSVGQSLAPLGARVFELSDAQDVSQRLALLACDLLVMDTDGLQRQWRAVARAALLGPRRIPVVLLPARFGFDEAHDALALGVSAVILKPFRPREHALRLYDLVLGHKGIRARRSEPRFALSEDLSARLDYEHRGVSGFGLVDQISRGGLSVAARPERLVAGSSLADATLRFGDAEARVSAVVVHCSPQRLGLRVQEWGAGRQRVMRALDELAQRAYGGGKENRRW